MEKPVKEAVSVVIRNAQGETLFALRSPHKKSHPLTWSLPSHYVAENETPDGTVARIGLHKLGAKLKLVRFLNEGYGDRPDFKLLMHVYEAEVVAGEPHIASDDYVELKWTKAEDFCLPYA